MLSNGSQREPGGTSVEEANGILESRVQSSFSTVRSHRGHRRSRLVRGFAAPGAPSVERANPSARAVSRSGAPASTASTARRFRRKRSRRAGLRMEASKVEMRLTRWSSSGSTSSDEGAARVWLLATSSGRGSGRMGGESGERQIRGVSRLSETEARSTSRWPRAAASAHRFQMAASRSARGHRSPRRSTTSWTHAASPQGQMTCKASERAGQAGNA
jgi:hypothetical protein